MQHCFLLLSTGDCSRSHIFIDVSFPGDRCCEGLGVSRLGRLRSTISGSESQTTPSSTKPTLLRRKDRAEIARFTAAGGGAEVTFSACSYRDWLRTWHDQEAVAHADPLVDVFAP